jgi:hypothetical protein
MGVSGRPAGLPAVGHPESPWTHPVCLGCYVLLWNRPPYRVESAEPEQCCWCRGLTTGGIYVRHDPALLPHCPERG